ncbi:MAG: YggS family pyridoxal phosphate-dependent enzyme [Steroidobacteraceae bacterium]
MLTLTQNLAENLRNVRNRLERAAADSGRSVSCVTLLAVSKTQPSEQIAALADLGQRDFGENYLQEALPKLAALRTRPLVWHFIGQLQSNKTRPVAEHFDWVHTVDRLRLAERLSAQRPFHAPPLKVCIQVRIGTEASKGGADAAELPGLVSAIRDLPRLELRGLMCLPPPETDYARQRAWLARLRELRDRLGGPRLLPDLSMGMSADLEAAVAEGATLVRIGTALFGPRPAAARTMDA